MNQNREAVLITGASKRIGLALATECLAMGFSAVIHYRTSAEPAQTEFKEREDVFFLQQELCELPQRLIERAGELPVTLRGLINNASVFTEGNLADSDHFEQIISTNVTVPVKLAGCFAQKVTEGWIVNITDAHIEGINRRYQNYRISKKLLNDITLQMAHLFAPAIRVNAIAPGAILPAAQETHSEFQALTEKIPLKRSGSVDDLRGTLRFLVENEYVTGEIIRVDGGWHLGKV